MASRQKISLMASGILMILLMSFSANALSADFAVYVGAGSWQPSIVAFENFLKWKNLTFKEVTKSEINSNDLRKLYRGIFFPGGWAFDYKRDISSAGRQNIKNLISGGGAYVGMSAGAYFACDKVVWEGKTYDYPMDLFAGKCIGPIKEIAPWPNYVMAAMSINKSHAANLHEPAQRSILYYGEPYFQPNAGQEMQAFASWIVPASPLAHNKPGIVGFNYGQGRVLLVGPHPEIEEDSSRDGTNFADELYDGTDHSDWPFLWSGLDWLLKKSITRAPNDDPSTDTIKPLITQVADYPDPADFGSDVSIEATATDNVGLDSVWLNLLGNDYFMEREYGGPSDLLSEGFESGSFASNGWVVYGAGTPWKVASTEPSSGIFHAQSQQSGAGSPTYLEMQTSTVGYNSITLSYKRKLVGLDSADGFSTAWFDGSAWNGIENVNSEDDSNYVSKSFTLPQPASENADFKIRFMCEAGAVSEYCRVDDVKLSATSSVVGWKRVLSAEGFVSGTYSYSVNANDTNGNLAAPVSGDFIIQ